MMQVNLQHRWQIPMNHPSQVRRRWQWWGIPSSSKINRARKKPLNVILLKQSPVSDIIISFFSVVYFHHSFDCGVDLIPLFTDITLQTQSQPATMVTNLLLSSQVSQSFSHSIGTPSGNSLPNPSSSETIKPVAPSSSSTIESMESSQLPLSSTHTNETISSFLSSDTSSTTQTQVSHRSDRVIVSIDFLI